MNPALVNFIKKIVTKNGIASFASVLFLFTFIAGIGVVAGIATAQAVEDLLPIIIAFGSGVMVTGLFFSLAAILDRQNIIGLMLLVQHNPEVQEYMIDTINGKKKKTK